MKILQNLHRTFHRLTGSTYFVRYKYDTFAGVYALEIFPTDNEQDAIADDILKWLPYEPTLNEIRAIRSGHGVTVINRW